MAKHIVHIPGAWHGPFYMDEVNKELQSRGYTVHGRQVPSIGSNLPPKDLSEDISFIQSLVEEAIGSEGNDVAVICHSWGGIVAGSALTGYGKEARAKAGKKGGVVRVGYMAAFLADEGVCLMDNMPGGQPLPWWDVQGSLVYATDPKVFYGDLPEAEQKQWFSKLQSHNYNSFFAKATGASWKEIPTSYLVCEDDMAIPLQGQEGMIQFAKSKGVEVDVDRLKASHSPFLSMPKETADWIVKVAGGK